MSIARNAMQQVTGWRCLCDQKRTIPLARRQCPHCGRAMSQLDRKTIYRLVLRELRPIYLTPAGKRWQSFAAICRGHRIAFWILMLLSLTLWAVFLYFWMPDSIPRLQSLLPPFGDMGKKVWSLGVEVVTTFWDMILNLVELIRQLLKNLR